jgi:Sugar (and other) transporter
MIQSIHYGSYVFFAFFCFLAGIWAALLVPETMGKILEEMDEAFGDGASVEEAFIIQEAVLYARRRSSVVVANKSA